MDEKTERGPAEEPAGAGLEPQRPRPPTRRKVLIAAGVGAAAAIAGTMPFVIARKWRKVEHVFLIIADALRADVIGKVVNGLEVTPNINRFAAEGVNFSRAYAPAPFTKCSVASIFSGLYPPGHCVEHPLFTLPDCLTISRFLSRRGYRCAALAANPYLQPEIGPGATLKPMDFGFNVGFDYYRTHIGRGTENEKAPTTLTELVRPVKGDFKRVGYTDGMALTGVLPRLIEARVKTFMGYKPLFAYVHYMDSHQPWLPNAPVKGITGRFHGDGAGAPDEVLADDVKLIFKALFSGAPKSELTAEDVARLKAVYLEAAAYLDRCVGELLSCLAAKGLYENATIFFTADHGDELMEHGRIGHNQNLFDTALRVPLIIKRKGHRPAEVAARVSNAGILPTVMEWSGAELASTIVPSLAPFMEDPSRGHVPVFASFERRDKIILPDGRACMDHHGSRLYFNVDSDPDEMAPLAEDAAVRAEMEKVRFHSERLGREAGVKTRFSTVKWQNPWAGEQQLAAEELVNAGKITAKEAARRKSFGEFIPEEGLKEIHADLGQVKIDTSQLSEEERQRLRALGYLQ